jgi:hypothetical protein
LETTLSAGSGRRTEGRLRKNPHSALNHCNRK